MAGERQPEQKQSGCYVRNEAMVACECSTRCAGQNCSIKLRFAVRLLRVEILVHKFAFRHQESEGGSISESEGDDDVFVWLISSVESVL